MQLKPQTGDWILPVGLAAFSSAIRAVTFGRVCHAAMVFDETQVFETDGSWRKAQFAPLSHYEGKEVYIVRPSFYNCPNDVKPRCKAYNGAPYSYWDILTNGAFGWLAPPIRKKVVKFLSNTRFMICSELVARITFEVTRQPLLRDFEGMTPEMLLELAYNHPALFTVEHTTLSL